MEILKYNDINIEKCFVQYHLNNLACECDGDKQEVNLMEE